VCADEGGMGLDDISGGAIRVDGGVWMEVVVAADAAAWGRKRG